MNECKSGLVASGQWQSGQWQSGEVVSAGDLDNLVIYLPFPPTVNSYYSSGKGHVKYVSKGGQQFRSLVAESLSEQVGRQATAERLNVEVVLFPPDRRLRDLDNYMKALLDALTLGGLWVDDGQIDQLAIYRGEVVSGGLTRVEVNLAGPVVRCQV